MGKREPPIRESLTAPHNAAEFTGEVKKRECFVYDTVFAERRSISVPARASGALRL